MEEFPTPQDYIDSNKDLIAGAIDIEGYFFETCADQD